MPTVPGRRRDARRGSPPVEEGADADLVAVGVGQDRERRRLGVVDDGAPAAKRRRCGRRPSRAPPTRRGASAVGEPRAARCPGTTSRAAGRWGRTPCRARRVGPPVSTAAQNGPSRPSSAVSSASSTWVTSPGHRGDLVLPRDVAEQPGEGHVVAVTQMPSRPTSVATRRSTWVGLIVASRWSASEACDAARTASVTNAAPAPASPCGTARGGAGRACASREPGVDDVLGGEVLHPPTMPPRTDTSPRVPARANRSLGGTGRVYL